MSLKNIIIVVFINLLTQWCLIKGYKINFYRFQKNFKTTLNEKNCEGCWEIVDWYTRYDESHCENQL